MNKVSMKNRNSGFTLVELMVVVLVVALVVLVSTQIPLFSLSSWRKGANRLRMQRDANLVMIKIQRKLRPASFTEDPVVSVPNDSTLVIGEDSFYVDEDEASDFFNDFVQESGGNKELIVEGDEGTDFKVVPEGTAIKMTLTLVREGVQTTLRTATKPRN